MRSSLFLICVPSVIETRSGASARRKSGTTKFLSGHGTVIGGVVVDADSFDWDQSGKFPELAEPYADFHNMVFTEESTVGAMALT